MLYEKKSALYLQDYSADDEKDPEDEGVSFKVPTDEELEDDVVDEEV